MPYRILLLVACLLLAQKGYSQPPAILRAEYAWTREAWTGNAKPYQAIQQRMVEMVREHKNTAALARQYGKLTGKQLASDPLAVYQWAYAAWFISGNAEDTQAERSRAMTALGKVPSPHVFEFDRLRFLLLCSDCPDVNLRTLGDRLLRRYPEDYWVILFHIQNLDSIANTKEREKAFALCAYLTKKYPKDPNGYTVLAFTWRHIGWATHKKADADRAIAAYRKAIALHSENAPERRVIEGQIQVIQKERSTYN